VLPTVFFACHLNRTGREQEKRLGHFTLAYQRLAWLASNSAELVPKQSLLIGRQLTEELRFRYEPDNRWG
jgi:hypothetical protein